MPKWSRLDWEGPYAYCIYQGHFAPVFIGQRSILYCSGINQDFQEIKGETSSIQNTELFKFFRSSLWRKKQKTKIILNKSLGIFKAEWLIAVINHLLLKEREEGWRLCFFKFWREKMNLYEGVWIKLISRETLLDEKNKYGDSFKASKRFLL